MPNVHAYSSHDEAGRADAPAIDATTGPYRRDILGVDVKFLCRECGTKLIVDARWQGRILDCPFCGKPAVVPDCADWLGPFEPTPRAAGVVGPVSPGSRLSDAEIEFFTKIG